MIEKMDDIGVSSHHYKNISNISVTIFLLILQAYLMLIFNGIDLFNFSWVQNDVWRYAVQVLVQLCFFSFFYVVIYYITKKIYCIHWIKKHKNIWIKGTWLHIHVKDEIRIGTVEIEQSFYTIKATGHNISPKIKKSTSVARETTWNYILSKVFDDETVRDFIGCYKADDIYNNVSKDGIHILQIEGRGENQKGGYANYMVGTFRDTVKIDRNEITDVNSQAGQLFFFRLSDNCREYLIDKSGFRYDLLFDMHENEKFRDEPYVIKLKEKISEFEKSSFRLKK